MPPAAVGTGLREASRPSGCEEPLLETARRISNRAGPQAEKSEVSTPAAVVPGDAPMPGSQGLTSRCALGGCSGQGALWVPYIRAPIARLRAPHGQPRPQAPPPDTVTWGLGRQRVSLRTQTLGPLTVCIFLFLPVAELSLSYQLPTGSGPATLQAHVAAPLCTVGGVTKRKQGLE